MACGPAYFSRVVKVLFRIWQVNYLRLHVHLQLTQLPWRLRPVSCSLCSAHGSYRHRVSPDALVSYSRARPPTRQPASHGPTCHCSSGQRHWPEPSAHGWPGASRTPAPPHLAALGVTCGTDITPAGRGHKPCCAGLWAVCTRGASHAADPPGPSPVQHNTDPSTPAAQAWQAPRAP